MHVIVGYALPLPLSISISKMRANGLFFNRTGKKICHREIKLAAWRAFCCIPQIALILAAFVA